MKSIYSFLFLLLLLCGCNMRRDTAMPDRLRCEYLTTPLCVDSPRPRLSWCVADTSAGFEQGAYRIEVASSEENLREGEADVWNSGKVTSSEMKAVYDGSTALLPQSRYYWRVTVWDRSGARSRVSDPTWFSTALFSAADWKARWISDGLDKETFAAPLFRKSFTLPVADVKRATLYCSGLGYGEFYLNGRRVGDSELDPGYTHFNKRVLYSSYAVEDLLQDGDNQLAAILGNGWFNEQLCGEWNFHKATWRHRPQLICELKVDYNDGSSEVIVSDHTWKTSVNSPFVKDNIYSGQTYDARLENDNWDLSSYNDSAWTQAVEVEAPAPLLVSQAMPPIRVTETVEAVDMKSFPGNIYVFDMGLTFAGVCQLKLKNTQPGTVITLHHAEILTPEGRLDDRYISKYFYPVDKTDVFQTDTYITRGGEEEVFQPRFTYHGFQYVEVKSSKPLELETEDLIGQFLHTDVENIGAFECSNPLLNTIWQATNVSYRSNLHSIPTDCPQREKNGWTADAHLALDFALYNYDAIKVYEKWVNDLCDNQRDKGDLTGIVPSSDWGYGIGPVWDAALFVVPMSLYNFYGDAHAIETAYEACERYLAFLATCEKDGGLIKYGLGDWVPFKTQTPNDYTSTAYYYYCTRLMARFAKITGRDATQWEQQAGRLKELIVRTYFDAAQNSFSNGSQTALAVALYFDLVPEGHEKQVAENLYKSLESTRFLPDFGVLGSRFIPDVLTRYGYVDAAYTLASQEDYPSWGYWFKHFGATSLYEQWGVRVDGDGSLNHVFLGDVSAWMVRALAGINYDPLSPGFSNVLLTPHFPVKLDEAKASYLSVRGLVASEWKRQGENIVWSFTVPAGSTATLRLPATVTLTDSDRAVRFEKSNDDLQQAQVSAGSFVLTLKQNANTK